MYLVIFFSRWLYFTSEAPRRLREGEAARAGHCQSGVDCQETWVRPLSRGWSRRVCVRVRGPVAVTPPFPCTSGAMSCDEETRRRWRVRRLWRSAVSNVSLRVIPNQSAMRRLRAVAAARASSSSSAHARESSVLDVAFHINVRTGRYGGLKSTILRSAAAKLGGMEDLLTAPKMEVKNQARRRERTKGLLSKTRSLTWLSRPNTAAAPAPLLDAALPGTVGPPGQGPSRNGAGEKPQAKARKSVDVVMTVDASQSGMLGRMKSRTTIMGEEARGQDWGDDWEENEVEAAAIPYHMQGNAALNTSEAFAQRAQLEDSALIQAESKKLWNLCLAHQEALYFGVDPGPGSAAQGGEGTNPKKRGGKIGGGKSGGSKKGAKRGAKDEGGREGRHFVRTASPNGARFCGPPRAEADWTPVEKRMYDGKLELDERAVNEEAYCALSMAFQRVLIEPLSWDDAQGQAVEDWECDSSGRDVMEWPTFAMGMFELAIKHS